MSISSIIVLFFLIFGYLLPIILTATSRKVRGVEKFCWVIAIMVSAWIGFIAFLCVTKLAERKSKSA